MADEKKRFRNIWARMDSDAEGEAVNAFMKIRELLSQENNKFIRLLDIFEENVSLDAYNSVKCERDTANASAQALRQQNAALAGEVNLLRRRLAQTGVAAGGWTRIDSYQSGAMGLLLGLGLALIFASSGINLSSTQWFAPAWDKLSQMMASSPDRSALQQIVDRTAWAEGDTASHVYRLDGPGSTRMYWVKLRRWKTDQVYVNAANEPATEYCTSVYAQEAAPVPNQPGLYEPPQEYDLSGRWDIVFHHAFDECVTRSVAAQPPDGKVASR